MQRSPDKTDEISEEKKDIKLNEKPKKFHNGWARQLEVLAAEWADKAACYRWMHEKTESNYSYYNMYFTIPVIILSTLTGTANFGVGSLLPDASLQKYASAIIGGISLVTGMISTVANFLRYAQASEAHRVAAISWGKFQRFISTELALHPNERMDAMSFLKMSRIELDRLIEQSPMIPNDIVKSFIREFKNKDDIKRPEIAGGIEHTKIFVDRDSRIARIAADATFMVKQKKALMREMILDDLDKRIVMKTIEERQLQEKDLLEQVVLAAKETATKLVQEKIPKVITVSSSAPTSIISTMDRSPPKIPPNTVSNVKASFEKVVADPKVIAAITKKANEIKKINTPDAIHLEIMDN